MDLSVLSNVPYCMDAFAKWTHEMPDLPMLVDDQHYKGWTRARIDDLSARIYGYLKRQGIGTNDFVMICLPRGIRPIVAMMGVWKAGAAFVVVEDTYAPDRIELIKLDCGCKLTIDMDLWEQIKNEEPLAGYERPDDHDAAFAVYTSGSTGRPKGVLHEFGDIKLDALVANLRTPRLRTRASSFATTSRTRSTSRTSRRPSSARWATTLGPTSRSCTPAASPPTACTCPASSW